MSVKRKKVNKLLKISISVVAYKVYM